jgi:hypothetical protein
MELKLKRFYTSPVDTLGILFINLAFSAFIIEDTKHDIKIPGKTRIPAGRYRIRLTYSPKFKKNMLEVCDVPNFTGIRIHPGNTAEDTQGCLMPGNICRFHDDGASRIEDSLIAYNRIYPIITKALEIEKVFIEITDNGDTFTG